MALPVPLGVRIYSAPLSFDLWVTKHVEGLRYRSAVPGGFMDATLRFRSYTPIDTPDVVIWNPTTSAVSADTQSFKVTDANAAPISIGDRFWAYDSGGNVRMNGDRFAVTAKSSSAGTTTVSYAPPSSSLIASGDSVICKRAASFYDSSLAGFNKMIRLFNRIQVVDLCTAEIAWEGRIEDPARETDNGTWTLGCLGTTVFATDIRRPMFYLDNKADSWLKSSQDGTLYTQDIDSTNNILKIGFVEGWAWGSNAAYQDYLRKQFIFQGPERCDMEGIGRFDAICNGNDNAIVNGKLGITLQARKWDNSIDPTAPDQRNIAQYRLTSAADFHTSRVVGSNIDDGSKHLFMAGGYFDTTGSDAVPGVSTWGSWTLPRVQAQRLDRHGNTLNTGASYPDGALKVAPIVEDVVGRFLVKGWDRSFDNNPYAGYVDENNVYIDTSNSVLMVDGWTFYDGVTAQEILQKVIDEAQPNAYWGIWESNFNATDRNIDSNCRFSFETWPASWGYQVTSVDGFTEQPNGEKAYSFVWYIYSNGYNENDLNIWSQGSKHVQTYWNRTLGSDLDLNQISRAQTIIRGSDTDIYAGSGVFTEAGQWITDNSHTVNSGQIKIARPVLVYDRGLNGPFGMARMLSPWMVRPGKLIRVMDVLPANFMNDFPYGSTTAPNRGHDNCVFRMVATEYDSDSNTTTVDLDAPPTWNVPQQIVTKQSALPKFITAYR
jgi:hypothetical protein